MPKSYFAASLRAKLEEADDTQVHSIYSAFSAQIERSLIAQFIEDLDRSPRPYSRQVEIMGTFSAVLRGDADTTADVATQPFLAQSPLRNQL